MNMSVVSEGLHQDRATFSPEPRRLTVLHVVAPAAVGGLERVARALAGGLRARGHEVHAALVLDRDASDHSFARALARDEVPVHVIRASRRAYIREGRRVAALCRELCPDIVHTHGYRPDVVAAAAARMAGIPTVSTVHGFVGGGWRDRLYERLQRLALRAADAVVAVSRPLAEALSRSGVPRDQVTVLPNAWAPNGPRVSRAAARRVLGLASDAYVVGWVGRLGREKGPDVFVDALARLRDVPLAVAVVGDGPDRRALWRRAAAQRVDTRVVWCGVVPDADRLFRAFDLFVLSSRTEGTPLVLLEAMAAGVPIVATAVGGVPDVVTPHEAWLVPPEDAEALAAAVRRARCDPHDARRRAAAAQRRLDAGFALGPWLDAYEAVYRRVCRAGRRPSA